jgi:outer membrane immunogenic protein
MRKTLLASVSVAVLCSATAVAAGPGPAAPLPTWTGFYFGVNAGYAWGNSDPSLIVNSSPPPSPIGPLGTISATPSLHPRGFIGGGQAGYNWQSGQWLIGGEVDISGISAKADATLSPFFTGKGGQNTGTMSSQYDWLFTARARGGFLVAPNWLLYVTGGLAVTRVNDMFTCTGRCGSGFSGIITSSDSTTLAGATIGGGVEAMLGQNWSARVEYLHASFKDTTPATTSFPIPTPPIPNLYSFHHELDIVRLALNFKFAP